MTREEIMALDMEALEQRAGEIAEETREASAETLDSFTAELDAIEERKNIIKPRPWRRGQRSRPSLPAWAKLLKNRFRREKP